MQVLCRTFIPSFAWGGPQGFTTYKVEKAFETAKIVMERRDLSLDEKEMKILENVFAQTAKWRRWEKIIMQ